LDAIRVEGLVKKYGWFFSRRKVIAVNDLSLSVTENQIFGFLGPNGAGKTTTIKILLGLIIPDAGRASIFETEVGDRAVKGRVGFLPDNPSFYDHLSGREFVAFCGKLMHLSRQDRYQRAEELLHKMGLAEAADAKIAGYSRGMLQRLGIAQALINNPDLVILDEPVTGLDPLGRREVKQILLDLRSEGKTVFFSSHVLADVQEMCDEVAILNHGRLLVKGEMDDILATKGLVFWVTGLGGDRLGEIETLADSIQKKGDRWGIELRDVAKRGDLVKVIEGLGGTVDEVSSQRESLEESFLRRIEEDDGRGKGDANHE
jgi:ABC-2 type transport system ATP-binding protein